MLFAAAKMEYIEILTMLLTKLGSAKQQRDAILKPLASGEFQGWNILFFIAAGGNTKLMSMVLAILSPEEQRRAILAPKKVPESFNALFHAADCSALTSRPVEKNCWSSSEVSQGIALTANSSQPDTVRFFSSSASTSPERSSSPAVVTSSSESTELNGQSLS